MRIPKSELEKLKERHSFKQTVNHSLTELLNCKSEEEFVTKLKKINFRDLKSFYHIQ